MLASFAIKKSIGQHYFAENTNNLYSQHFNFTNSDFVNYNFDLDYAKIINSTAFRRLQYKTQVFVNHQGDHYRTRLTHSLEVAYIARFLATNLNINKILAENISLAHDLGHPPFGHAGENALNTKMKNFGGFSHNDHTLKIITQIENYSANYLGLNLSWEMLEGVVKHNGKILQPSLAVANYNKQFNLQLNKNPSLEAQIASLADDIAYNNHDLEDGIRANLFQVSDILDLPLIGSVYSDLIAKYSNLKTEILVCEAKKQLTLTMMIDVINQTKKNLQTLKIKSFQEIQDQENFVASFSPEMLNIQQKIKIFLQKNMYKHSLVNTMTCNAEKIIADLFDFYFANPNMLINNFNQNINHEQQLADAICKYIAGMTDRFAYKQHDKFIL
jgi:dGTPase